MTQPLQRSSDMALSVLGPVRAWSWEDEGSIESPCPQPPPHPHWNLGALYSLLPEQWHVPS